METLLVGRGIQGLGVGGLIMPAYAVYGDMEHSQSGLRFLRAIVCSINIPHCVKRNTPYRKI
jgi:hypothetical protein